jgi:hypothetical protein
MCCAVLYCTVLYCTVLYCAAVLYSMVTYSCADLGDYRIKSFMLHHELIRFNKRPNE